MNLNIYFGDNADLFILCWQLKRTNDYKGYKFNCFFKTSFYFSSPFNKIVQGICKPCPSLKLTLFPVTVILAVLNGLGRKKWKTVLACRPVFLFFKWPITRASLVTATTYLSMSFSGYGRVDKFSPKIGVQSFI